MMEITRALKCCQNLYQVVICPRPGDFFFFFFFLNYDTGLTLTIFMTVSNLFHDASVWVTAYKALGVYVFPSLI